jgi:hypothetical protein
MIYWSQVNTKMVVEGIRFGSNSIPLLDDIYFSILFSVFRLMEQGIRSRHDLNAGLLFESDL